MYVYMVRSEFDYDVLQVCNNEAIFDSVDKAIQFINEWDPETELEDEDNEIITIVRDETRGEGLCFVRTIIYENWRVDDEGNSVDLFIDKYEVNSVIH